MKIRLNAIGFVAGCISVCVYIAQDASVGMWLGWATASLMFLSAWLRDIADDLKKEER